MGKSVSFCKGKGSLAHNNREFITPNVDQSRTHDNITYKQEPLALAYEKLFGEAVEQYNAAQKRADRKIDDYMEKIRTSKNGEKLFYENVVQVGTMYSCPVGSKDGETASKILDEYMKDFERRNPNIHVFNAVLHLDEATPHLHIDWIPVARDYQKGLQVRNSLDKALKQQGIDGNSGKKGNSTQKWQEQERDALIEVMERHGWGYEASLDTDRGNLTVSQYKAMVEEVDNRANALPDHIEGKKRSFLSKDKVTISASDLEALEERAKLKRIRDDVTGGLREYHAEKKNEIDAYVEEVLKAVNEKKAAADKELQIAFSMKQEAGRSLADANAEKEKYRKLHAAQRGLNDAYKNILAENERLKDENSSLRAQIADLRASVAQRVQMATEPLKGQIEALTAKLREVALGEATLMKAVKYVADHFSGEVSGTILRATYQRGNEWLKTDGFEDLAYQTPSLPKSIASEMNIKLTFKDGDEGRGVYSPNNTCVMNVKTIKEAREHFPNCQIDNKVKSKMLSQEIG